jgi:NitT/TauT family transport system ATP-binding protein
MRDEFRVNDVSKAFDELVVLVNIQLKVRRGHIHTFLGPSGCGKTTLLRILSGFEQPTSGEVLHGDEPVRGPSARRGFMFQEGICFPWRTVMRNVTFGLEIKGTARLEREEIARRYVKLVGLEGFEGYYPAQLSGGMRQRMVLATVLANEPDVLLMDEPFGALDAQTRELMQRELLRIWTETQKTIIFVTHSIREALLISNHLSVFLTRPGRIAETIDLDRALGCSSPERAPTQRALVEMEEVLHRRMAAGTDR